MEQPKQISIKASDEDLKGKYANAMQIVHSSEEFTLDFLNLTPPAGQLVARIITSPGHMKRILLALQDNVSKYEAKYGPIKEANVPQAETKFSPPS